MTSVLVVTKGMILYKAHMISRYSKSALGIECLLDPDYIMKCDATAMNFVRYTTASIDLANGAHFGAI